MNPGSPELVLLSRLEPELVEALRGWSTGPGWMVYDLPGGEPGPVLRAGALHLPGRWLPADPTEILAAVDWAAQEKHSVRGTRELRVQDVGTAARCRGYVVGTDRKADWTVVGKTPRLAALRLLQRVWWGSLSDHVLALTLAHVERTNSQPSRLHMAESELVELQQWWNGGLRIPAPPGAVTTVYGVPVVPESEPDNIRVD